MKAVGTTLSTLGVASLLALGLALPAGAQETKSEPEKKAAETQPKQAVQAAEPAKKAKGGGTDDIATIVTNLGTIKVKFFPDAAPKAVENFKGLAAKGYYNGVIFHRVIEGFMIQGGDPTGTGRGGESFWGKAFEDEFSPKYRFDRKGLLAMANAGPKTNGSQFFITLAPTAWLNDKHSIFGEVISGMDVVDKIAKVKKGPGDKPVEPVTMKSVTIGPAKPAEGAAPPKGDK
jgi:cyclophilin family peptidyl-prolyl cis-trans isomerase